jgi:hypothetical protein
MKKPEEKVSSKKASKKTTLAYTVETLYPLFIIFIDNRSAKDSSTTLILTSLILGFGQGCVLLPPSL